MTAKPRRQKSDSVAPPAFDAAFRARLGALIRWRRDVRRFRRDPVAPKILDELLGLAVLAPSVGYSQPWRFVTVDDPARRRAVQDNFKRANKEALEDYRGDRAKLYAQLKLSGLEEAPVQLAVFCDEATDTGHGLGQRTMPETRRYSVVTAVHTLWLAARAHGLGLGWVSILICARSRRPWRCPATGRWSPTCASAIRRKNTWTRSWPVRAGRRGRIFRIA